MIMRFLRLMFSLAMLLGAVGCLPEEEAKSYEEITSLEGTLWWGYEVDSKGVPTYLDVHFDKDSGSVKGYDTPERKTEVSSQTFSYSFTLKSGAMLNSTVVIEFEQEGRYEGYLIHKGNVQINYTDAYVLSLFKVDDNGNVLLDEEGNPAETKTYWRE